MQFPRRKRKPRIFRTPRFFRFFRDNTGALLYSGNRVLLLDDGVVFFPALLEGIATARHSLLVEFYIIRDDRAGRAFADALIAAVRRGVTVRLLYDYIGCFDTPSAYFRRLQKEGVACISFNPPPFRRGIAWFDKRDHRKMAIIDGLFAFVGGLNIGDEYVDPQRAARWRDVGMRLSGPAVKGLEEIFREGWTGEGGILPPSEGEPPQGGDADVIIISGGPHHNRSYIRSAYRMAIAGASESVRILTPYFLPGPRIIRSLLRAAGRGVRVQMILPGICDVPLVRLLSRGFFHPLLKAGVEIYERGGTVLHAKVMTIDGNWSIFGSANLDHRSFHRNYEVNVIVDSPVFGSQVEEMFEEDLALSRRITLEEHEARGRCGRLLEFLFSPISRFL